MQETYLKYNFFHKNILFQNNILLFQTKKRIKVKTNNSYLKLLRDKSKIDLINNFDKTSVIYRIIPKQYKNIINDNKIEIKEKKTILNPFIKIFDDSNNVKIENLYYSSLSYNIYIIISIILNSS